MKHQQCPRCRKEGRDTSKDNLAIYENGVYCFSCGYSKTTQATVFSIKRRIEAVKDLPASDSISLPTDASPVIDKSGIDWLMQYDLTPAEISEYWLWSPSKNQLIFSMLDNNQLLCYSARNFSPSSRKYFTAGKIDEIFCFLGEGEPLVIVEDAVSAIKVSRHCQALPLFSGHASKKKIYRLKQLGYNSLCFWLDKDKAAQSSYHTKYALSIGLQARTIITDLDPKCYSDDEIKKEIGL